MVRTILHRNYVKYRLHCGVEHLVARNVDSTVLPEEGLEVVYLWSFPTAGCGL